MVGAFAAALRAQDEPLTPTEQILRNRNRLKVTLTTDRVEYLPHEIIELTISVENPTSETLTIPKPFIYQTGWLEYLDATHQRLASEPYRNPTEHRPMPTSTIGPGEVLVHKLHSYDDGIAWQIASGSSGAAPNWPGEFHLRYWSAQADFRVVVPFYGGMIEIPWPEWDERQTGDPDHKTVRAQKNLYAFVLAMNGKHFVCLTKTPYSGRVDIPRTDSNGKLIYQDFQLFRYSRVAESDTPIVSLKGEADALGRIQLTWGAAGEGRLFIDRSDSILNPPKAAK